MTDTISIKEKAAVQTRIGELNTHKTSVTALGRTAPPGEARAAAPRTRR